MPDLKGGVMLRFLSLFSIPENDHGLIDDRKDMKIIFYNEFAVVDTLPSVKIRRIATLFQERIMDTGPISVLP